MDSTRVLVLALLPPTQVLKTWGDMTALMSEADTMRANTPECQGSGKEAAHDQHSLIT